MGLNTEITCFDDLLRAAHERRERLLLVFAGAELPADATPEQRARFAQGEGGALVPLMCVDKPPEELASFDAGSINQGGGVFINDPAFLDEAARMMRESGVKPEIEVFDLGMLVTALRMRDEGKLDDPLHFQFVLGTPWGAPATPKSLLHLHEHLPEGATWSTIGIGRGYLPMAMMALIMGGHIRVGMEDNIYLDRGVMAKTNAELVERVARIVAACGRPIASPTEARAILSLKSA